MYADHEFSNFDKQDALLRLSVPIPFNEEERLTVLRHSQHPNSNDVDPALDKFTSICQRFFNVPIALVSLVDVNKQWLKSNIELDAIHTDRNLAFCVYTALSASPEVFVVADTLTDERFSKNILVTGFPFIRFYAGAALIVEGAGIGSICIIDLAARHDFSQVDRMNLLDLASALSSLITSQRKAAATIESMNAEKIIDDQIYITNNVIADKKSLMVDMMHQVRTPLMSIQLNTSLVESSQLELAEYLKEDSHGTKLSNNVTTSLSELKCAISQLDAFVAASLQLNEHSIKSDKNIDINAKIILPTKKSPVLSHWNDLFLTIQNSLSLLSKLLEVQWNIDDKLTDATIRNHPELMTFIIGYLIDKSFIYWMKANITINFKSYKDTPNLGVTSTTTTTTTNTVTTPLDSQNISSDSNINDIKPGYLSIMINLSQPKAITSSTSSSSHNSNHLIIDLQTIERELHDIGGDCRSFNFDATSSSSYFESQNIINEQFFEFCLPCDLFLSNYQIMVSRKNSIFIPTENNNKNNNNNNNSHDSITLSENSNSNSNINYHLKNDVEMKNQCNILLDKSGGVGRRGGSSSSGPRTTSICHNNTIMSPTNITNIPMYKESIKSKPSKLENPRPLETEEKYNHSNSNSNNCSLNPLQEISNRSFTSDYKPLKVLIVDDSVAIYKVLKRWLETEGCDVTVAENGWIGLNYLQTQSFDITLMDFIMPVMLGRDAMRLFQEWKLKSCLNNSNDDMLLVGMSANASQRDQEEAYQYGMHFFASKPVDLDFLSIILSAKSKYTSLSIVVQTITVNSTKAKANETTDGSSSSNTVFIQRKKDRLKKASSVSALSTYHHRLSSDSSCSIVKKGITGTTATGTGTGHDTAEVTATDVNIDFTSHVKAASTGTTSPHYHHHHHNQINPNPIASTTMSSNTTSTTSNTRTLLSRFRRNLFSQFFNDLSKTDSKINPCMDDEVEQQDV